MGFSENLRELRQKKGLSQKKLADLASVSQTAVYQWEKGLRCPKIEQLQRIASALDVNIEDLVDSTVLDITNDVIALFSNSDISSESLEPDNPQENFMLSKFRDLNEKGQKKAADYIEDLVQMPEYTKDEKHALSNYLEFMSNKNPDFWINIKDVLKEISQPNNETELSEFAELLNNLRSN